jgi:hypothetical protein
VAAATLLVVEGSKGVLKLEETCDALHQSMLHCRYHVGLIKTFNRFVSCNLALGQGLL